MNEEAMRYKEALRELEEILEEIEAEEVDLDDLGDKVARAAQLIGVCREKIERAEVEIKRIVDGLNETA